MSERTSYLPGTPSWVDLATPDPVIAQAFYGALFGWEFTANPTGTGGEYIMASLDGHTVAGMMQQAPEQTEMGVPPMWNTYVTVEDIGVATDKAAAAGGQVVAPPMDVMDAGKMSVILDPTGAPICLWEAVNHIGAGLVNDHGALIWNELNTPDLDTSKTFYGELFGWGSLEHDMGEGNPPYTTFQLGEDGIGGALTPPAGTPSYWAVYFGSTDVDATVVTAGELGANVLLQPMDFPFGRMAVLADPTGAVFSLISASAGQET